MSEAKPTPGLCWVDAHMNVISSAGLVAFPGCSAGFDQKKNAHLIAEAFNVQLTTGLTPSQLVEQRDQLVERVKGLEAVTETLLRWLPTAAEMRAFGYHPAAVERARDARHRAIAALSKARPNTAEGSDDCD